MSLSREDVERIAWLARIRIDDEDIPGYVRNLSDILEFVAQMNAVDTGAISPMAHPMEASQRLRDDAVTEADQREVFQAIAPRVEEGLYLVPRVIE
jgi:aspartyl-tRNA(Asn)/glutamyl-tRNA(Gln) amidotransferase subunit C